MQKSWKATNKWLKEHDSWFYTEKKFYQTSKQTKTTPPKKNPRNKAKYLPLKEIILIVNWIRGELKSEAELEQV